MQETYGRREEIDRLIAIALEEDIGRGDITSELVVPEHATARFVLSNRSEIVACGVSLVAAIFRDYADITECNVQVKEGERVAAGGVLLKGSGNARDVLKVERVVLNILQHMCGIATLTRRYVDAVEGTGALILDTRKTLPGLRELEKWAVRAGGGRNHRFRLDDGVLIKDNHISVAGSITKAVTLAKAGTPFLTAVEVECETLEQVKEALAAGADKIMLDNMSLSELRSAVAWVAGRAPLEASGNVSLDTVRSIAETGVNFISIGKLTHSAPAADIGLDVVIK